MAKSWTSALQLISVLYLVSGCAPVRRDASAVSGDGHGEGAKEFFQSNQLIGVQLGMAPQDFEAMRSEGRDISDKIVECRPAGEGTEAYRSYQGRNIVVNGRSFGQATVKKKGYLGSLSAARPSFKLKDFAEKVPDYLDKMVLNSDRQDPSHIKQCLAYYFFKKAGLPSPKCALARVDIATNGPNSSSGVYTIIEDPEDAYDKIDHDKGVLVEGTHADFTAVGKLRFEIKAGLGKKDGKGDARSMVMMRIDEITEILASEPNDASFQRISNLVDLDQFYRYWATEAMVGHWDGYANNMNNFMIFFPLKDDHIGKIEFVPWGTDGTFVKKDIINRNVRDRLMHVSASASLPRWLLRYPPSRQTYLSTLRSLLNSVWDNGAFAEFQRLRSIASSAGPAVLGPDFQPTVSRIEEYLKTQKGVFQSELSMDNSGRYMSMELGQITCWVPIAEISGTVQAPRANSPMEFASSGVANSSITVILIQDGQKKSVPVTVQGSSFSTRQDFENRDASVTVSFNSPALPGANLAFSTVTERGLFKPGANLRYLGYANTGALMIQANPAAGEAGWMELGLAGGGSIKVIEGSSESSGAEYTLSPNAKISFQGTVYSKYPLSVILNKLKSGH